MHFSVRHWTRYAYSVPVALGEHLVRLVPQGSQVLLHDHRLVVDPVPTLHTPAFDPYGNRVLRLVFEGETPSLSLESHAEASVGRPQFWRNPGWDRLPWHDSPGPHPVDDAVRDFAHTLAHRATFDAGMFLVDLTQEIFQRTDRRLRLEGDARAAAETLATREGACRDLTLLFLDCCRSLGIEGRFVSGYQAAAETPDRQHHLHAWAEVRVPELGWRGFDPTHGVLVEDGHLPLCSAPTQRETMSVEGNYSFQGNALTSTLDFQVTISTR